MEYWYLYRDDLIKKVTVFDFPPAQSYHERKADSEDKLLNNIRRAQMKIEAYALCNEWDWFGTFTLNPEYRDRKDLDGFRDSLMHFIRDKRVKYGCDIRALLVPELHKNKEGWHMHGLIAGLPLEALRVFTERERIPRYIKGKVKAGEAVYDWPEYRERFGWVDIEPVKNRDAAARYITKYLRKDGETTAKHLELGKHLYYVTRGLNKPVRLEMENASGEVPEALTNEFVLGKELIYEDYGISVEWFENLKSKR